MLAGIPVNRLYGIISRIITVYLSNNCVIFDLWFIMKFIYYGWKLSGIPINNEFVAAARLRTGPRVPRPPCALRVITRVDTDPSGGSPAGAVRQIEAL